MRRFCTHVGLVLIVVSGLKLGLAHSMELEETLHSLCADSGCGARSAKPGDNSTPSCGAGGTVCTYTGSDPDVYCQCVNTPADSKKCDCFTYLIN